MQPFIQLSMPLHINTMVSFITACEDSALIALLCAVCMTLVYGTIKLVVARAAFYQKVRQGLVRIPLPNFCSPRNHADV